MQIANVVWSVDASQQAANEFLEDLFQHNSDNIYSLTFTLVGDCRNCTATDLSFFPERLVREEEEDEDEGNEQQVWVNETELFFFRLLHQ